MSEPNPEKPPEDDPLLVALRALPSRSMDDSSFPRPPESSPSALGAPGSGEARLLRQARAAYLRSFEDTPWHVSATGIVGRAAVPVFLAGVVGVYMMWAIAAATALVH
jgi:hypothetical protein